MPPVVNFMTGGRLFLLKSFFNMTSKNALHRSLPCDTIIMLIKRKEVRTWFVETTHNNWTACLPGAKDSFCNDSTCNLNRTRERFLPGIFMPGRQTIRVFSRPEKQRRAFSCPGHLYHAGLFYARNKESKRMHTAWTHYVTSSIPMHWNRLMTLPESVARLS